jgi:hypothetical protein
VRPWQGLSSKTSAVDSTVGISAEQTNTRLQTEGELQRRWGFLSTCIARQDGRIRNIVSAYPAGGNYLTFDVEGPGGTSDIGGFGDPPPPPWLPPKKKKVIINPPQACTIWGNDSDSGSSVNITVSYTLPAGSCAGTLEVFGNEDFNRPRGDDYGYSFTADFDGVNAFASGCLVNSSSSIAIPPGTLTVDVHVQVQCVFPLGTTPGNWVVNVTCP